MKKLAVLCVAALGAAMLVLGAAPAASAYPDLTCEVTVSAQVVRPGDTFRVTGRTKVAVDSKNQPVPSSDIKWTFEWNGVVEHRTGKDVEATFTAPQVSQTRKITLTAKNTTGDRSCEQHFDVSVVAAAVAGPHVSGSAGDNGLPNTGDNSDSGLPNTGGPAFWALVAGLALLLGGGGAVVVSRRRRDTT